MNKKEIYTAAQMLGLSKKEIETSLENITAETENTNLKLGGPFYPGGRYGTVSINDFNHHRRQ